jgi:tetratricopeptide (TPR) repeat protein
LAEVAIARRDWDGAREEIRRQRSMDEKGTAELLEGEILIRTGRWGRAEAVVDEAVSTLGPAARSRLAEVYLEVERPEAGEELLRAWVAAEPKNPHSHFQLGSYLYRAGDFGAAESELRETFRIDPTHSAALNFLGYSLAERSERLEEAVDLIKRALALEEWNGAFLDSLGWAYYQLGRYDEARDPLERAAREYPFDPVVLEHLGDLYARTGADDLAIAAWSRALDAGAESPRALRAKIEDRRAVVEEAAARSGLEAAGDAPE